MELLWWLLFVVLCLAVGGLLVLCDRWVVPARSTRR